MSPSQNLVANRCPDCDAAITTDDINIREGVALCPGCGALKRLGELSLSSRPVTEILATPPAGCTAEPYGQGARVTASLRSVGGFIATCFFALFWNGIVSVFVVHALCGLYANLVGPLPAWLPALDAKNGVPRLNGAPMELGATLGLCLFLVPFVVIGAAMVFAALTYLFGRVEVVIDEYGSHVATGVWFLKWKRRFDALDVTAVSPTWTSWTENDQRKKQIEITADRPIKFGSMLRDDRLEWLRTVLHELFSGKQDGRNRSDLPSLLWLPQRK